jgi:hypothetical protein
MYLDTIRLIAKHTDNIVDELWNYIEQGKLVQVLICCWLLRSNYVFG